MTEPDLSYSVDVGYRAAIRAVMNGQADRVTTEDGRTWTVNGRTYNENDKFGWLMERILGFVHDLFVRFSDDYHLKFLGARRTVNNQWKSVQPISFTSEEVRETSSKITAFVATLDELFKNKANSDQALIGIAFPAGLIGLEAKFNKEIEDLQKPQPAPHPEEPKKLTRTASLKALAAKITKKKKPTSAPAPESAQPNREALDAAIAKRDILQPVIRFNRDFGIFKTNFGELIKKVDQAHTDLYGQIHDYDDKRFTDAYALKARVAALEQKFLALK